ncbi:MAG: transglutaminaseTgpA domain-containing protein, partial [Gammaproteobacteria bacterium]|nr:transglutaminaseTgpA domain-containing protein [Gammaproteobacteria bacterium]
MTNAPVAERQHERRQVAWAAAAVIFGGAPHLFAVAPWVSFLVLGLALWRIVAAARGWGLPSLWIRVPVTALGFAAVLVTYRSISGVEGGSALLLVMAGLKLLETRAERDRVLVVFIGYFLLFTVFLRDQAIWSMVWLALGALGITAALAQSVRRDRLLSVPAAAALSGRLLLQALPRFHQRHPAIQVHLREAEGEDQLLAVARGEADL